MLTNGCGKSVPLTREAIKKEASLNGKTSYVCADLPKEQIVISQHESGDWDIAINEEPYRTFAEEEAEEAVFAFINLVKRN